MNKELIKKGTKCDLYVKGMHCPACKIVIEKKLTDSGIVKNVNAVMNEKKLYFETETEIEKNALVEEINWIIRNDGYTVSENLYKHRINWKDLLKGGLIAAVIIIAFILLQKSGFTNMLQVSDLSLPVVFLIGVIASLSSCMAVVGGLVLSISSNYARTQEKIRPLILFHTARIVGFFLLGGVLGLIGSVFAISPILYFIISIVLFLVMMILGLNLLEIFPFLQKFQLRIPGSFTRKLVENRNLHNKFTPVILGAITFFLPCGFTQSMQIGAIATGSFWNGAILMLVFAAGTLPVLAIISFTSIRFSKTPFSGIFFKTAGFMVIFFALFNFINSLVSMGIISPFF